MCDVYVETLRGSKMANLLGRFGDVIFDGNSKRSCTPAFLQSQPIGCRNCCLHERYYSLSREYCSAPQRIRATLRLDRSAEPMEKLGHDRARRSPSKIKIFRMHFPNIPRRRGNNFIGFVVTNQHFGSAQTLMKNSHRGNPASPFLLVVINPPPLHRCWVNNILSSRRRRKSKSRPGDKRKKRLNES